MRAVRSNFVPDNLEFQVGDVVSFHITNVEQTHGMSHGFGLGSHNVNVDISAGETRTVTIELDRPGVFPFYCTVSAPPYPRQCRVTSSYTRRESHRARDG